MTQHLDRRHFLGLAGVTASAAALAACGGPSTSGTPVASEAADLDFSGVTPAAKIDFWSNHPGKSQDVEKAIIEKFHAKYPDIRVNLVTAGANYEEIAQKFQTSQAAKSGLPGVVVLSDVWWFRYFTNGSIIPVDALVKQLDIKLDDFRQSLVDDYKYNDKQWAQDSIYKNGWAGVSSKEAADDFSAGLTSSTISSTGSLLGVLKSAPFNVGVGFLPGGPKAETNVCPTGGAGLGIPSGISKEEQLAAGTFLKFMTEPENSAAFSAATGYMPTRESADMKAVLAQTPQIQTAVDQLAVTRVQDNARVFLPGADQELAKAAAAILTQQADVKATMASLKKTLEGIYEKDVKPKLNA